MKKLIELDATLDALREVIVPAEDIGFGDESTDGYNDGINMAITVLGSQPAVDAVPVVHGRWTDKDGGIATCSACGDRWGAWSVMKYCPNCGARMDGKNGNHEKTD